MSDTSFVFGSCSDVELIKRLNSLPDHLRQDFKARIDKAAFTIEKNNRSPSKKFGTRLSAYMDEHQISQTDLANAIGLSMSMVSHLCTNRRTPSFGVTRAIFNYLWSESKTQTPADFERICMLFFA